MQLDFSAMFAAHVAATQKEWAHDRSQSVGASEVFGCLRKAWLKKRGPEFTERVQVGVETADSGATEVIDGQEYPMFIETPIYADVPKYPKDEDQEDSWGAARRGDILEAHFVVPAIRDNLPKGKMLLAGSEQKTFHHGRNSATPDGLIVGVDRDALALYGIKDIGSNCFGFEIKSIDPRVRLEEEKSIHNGQAQAQMGLVREKTPYKPNYTVILYVDASFLDKIKVFVVKFDEEAWEAAQIRANEVFSVDDPSLIQPEGLLDNECAFCEFTTSCAKITIGSIPDDNSKLAKKDEALLQEFDPLAAEFKEAQAAVKDSEHVFEQVKQKIKDALRLAGTRKIGGKPAKRPWSMSWYGQKGQKRLDSKLLTEALGDLEPYKSEGTPFDVLRVTFTDDKPAADTNISDESA